MKCQHLILGLMLIILNLNIYNTLKNTIYNKSTLRGYNAYNVIIVGTGNCSGIARAFRMLKYNK